MKRPLSPSTLLEDSLEIGLVPEPLVGAEGCRPGPLRVPPPGALPANGDQADVKRFRPLVRRRFRTRRPFLGADLYQEAVCPLLTAAVRPGRSFDGLFSIPWTLRAQTKRVFTVVDERRRCQRRTAGRTSGIRADCQDPGAPTSPPWQEVSLAEGLPASFTAVETPV